MKTSVVIIDDDTLLASSLSAGLRAWGLEVTGSFPNAAGVVQHAVSTNTDVAIVDFDLGPGPTGIDLARALRERVPTIGIVILTTYSDPRLKTSGLPALPKGAAYVTKTSVGDVADLARVVDKVARNPMSGNEVRNDLAVLDLTATQLDILRSVAHGLTTTQIASDRGVSTKAVEQHLKKIYDVLKLPRGTEMNQRVHLVREYLSRAGLLD
ncbi:MAG TPA: response regulator transcription factor [Acidimicrobiia bacterium]